MFDPEAYVVGGVQLIALVFGLVEFLKGLLGWSGKRVTMLAAVLGAVILTAYQLIGIVPQPYGQAVEILFTSAAFGLAASGYYKFISKRAPASG